MPQFVRDSDYYYCSLITGPSHVLLGLTFDTEWASELLIEKRPPIGGCDHGVLDEHEIAKAVRSGVEKASNEAATPLYPIAFAYIENDSRRYSMYEYAAYLIAQRLIAKGEFLESGPSDYRAS